MVKAVALHQRLAGENRLMRPAAAGIRLEIELHDVVAAAEIIEILRVLGQLKQVRPSGLAAKRFQHSHRAHERTEGHAVLVHGWILHRAHHGGHRRVEIRDGKRVVELLLVKAVQSADACRRAEGTVGASAVQEFVVILHGERPAD